MDSDRLVRTHDAQPDQEEVSQLAEDHRRERRPLTRREMLKIVGGTLVLVVGGWALLWLGAWEFVRWTEDFFPGTAPTDVLEANAWEVTDDSVVFAAVGDTGTGGKNQMDVAQAMVNAYKDKPYGLVAHVGDVSYYGSIVDRWPEVWEEPYKPLHDANVVFQIALGNHELEERASEDVQEWIAERLAQFGYDSTYRVISHGPIDFFFLDTSTPIMTGERSGVQQAWLEQALAESDAEWKVAVMHHAPYSSSPKRGSFTEFRDIVHPLFVEHGVQLVLAGHDHIYERTQPQDDVTYVVTGAGAKLSDIGTSDFTAVTKKVLQFMLVEIEGDLMTIQAIDTTGTVFDEVAIDKDGIEEP